MLSGIILFPEKQISLKNMYVVFLMEVNNLIEYLQGAARLQLVVRPIVHNTVWSFGLSGPYQSLV
ncbi:hypothetical protein GCM10011340_17490 [Roseivirga thermotolerans]|uniref:Uncharacterized protein n=1 Tax=Roseivirga thermotolerans TaxID=1758176 RepID=A0ABQ3I809_9BACT|nr:hypothetical protein GCM10011340_17490 [Roseivirga thermotolerans]